MDKPWPGGEKRVWGGGAEIQVEETAHSFLESPREEEEGAIRWRDHKSIVQHSPVLSNGARGLGRARACSLEY